MVAAVFQGQVVDDEGNVVPNAQISVTYEELIGAPLLWANRAATIAQSNPFNADSQGFFRFFARGGAYRITATSGSFSREWRYAAIGLGAESDGGPWQVSGELTSPSELPPVGQAGEAYKVGDYFYAWSEPDQQWINLGLVQGPAGPAGPTGSAAYRYSTTTTDADPGAGYLRFNNANPASATRLYISETNEGGVSLAGWIGAWGTAGTSTLRGHLEVYARDNPTTIFRRYAVTGTVTDDGNYRDVVITHLVGAGTLLDDTAVIVAFFPAGPQGAIAFAGTAPVDNALARFDGTTGAIIQRTGITVDDSNNVAGVNTLNIGNADTTLSRDSAGWLSVEGNVQARRDPSVTSFSGDFTLAASDAGRARWNNVNSPNNATVTIPANATVAFAIGTIINLLQRGTGQFTVQGDTGVTVNGVSAGSVVCSTRWQGVALLKVATDEWIVSGALDA